MSGQARKRALARVGPLKDWVEHAQDGHDPFSNRIQHQEQIPRLADRYIAGEVGVIIDVWIGSARDDDYADHFFAYVWRAANLSEVDLTYSVSQEWLAVEVGPAG